MADQPQRYLQPGRIGQLYSTSTEYKEEESLHVEGSDAQRTAEAYGWQSAGGLLLVLALEAAELGP